MANTSSAKKALRSSKAKETVNKARKSRIRTFIKKVEDLITKNDEPNARVAFKELEPELMKGVTKKVFKLGTAARKLGRLGAAIRRIKDAKPVEERVVKSKKTADKKALAKKAKAARSKSSARASK
ncbi:MAG: small subunit ribosomal protein S20 [Rickettsiales bacterium]|jgi:small subunit ribosomal protein S20